jgi:hypothetical protein
VSAQPKLRPEYQSRVEWLRVSDLDVEELAQRPLDVKWAKEIGDALNPDLIGFPAVCAIPTKTGERYHVADGQHRVKAVALALGDDQMIQCEVIRGISLQQAAAIFRGRNRTRSVKPIDKFLVGITAGDDECLKIGAIVEGLGLKVARGSNDGAITAVVALQWVYRGEKSRGNGKNEIALKRTLNTMMQAWGKGADVWHGDVIRGLGAVVLRHGDVLEYDGLENRLRQFKGGALGLIGAARAIREGFGGSIANGVATRLIREYNKGRKQANKLPEWMRGQDDA